MRLHSAASQNTAIFKIARTIELIRQNVKCHQKIEYFFGPVTGIVRDSSEDNTSPTPANNSETARDGKTLEIR
jgi:hypothetical protein